MSNTAIAQPNDHGQSLEYLEVLMIQRYKEAIVRIPLGHADLGGCLYELGVTYSERFQRMHIAQDLEAALRFQYAAVEATLLGHPNLSALQWNLALLFTDRFQGTDDLQDLQSALMHNQLAVDSTPPGHPNLLVFQQTLAASFTDRFRKLGNIKDLEIALKYDKEVVDGTPEGDPYLPSRQQSLAVSFTDMFRRMGNLQDLEAAMTYNQAAVNGTPLGDSNLAAYLQTLGASYMDKFHRLGNIWDLEAALKCKQGAAESVPQNHPGFLRIQQSLALSFSERFQRTGDMRDLETALRHKQAVVKGTPSNHPDLRSHKHSLALSLHQKFRSQGDFQDLQKASRYYQEIIDGMQPGHPDLPKYEHSLGTSFLDRFYITGNIQDLETGISYNQAAVNGAPEGHPDLPSHQANLASSLIAKFRRKGSIPDLERALEYNKTAVDSTPSDHPELPTLWHNLAVTFAEKFRRLGDNNDLEQALIYKQAAVDKTPNDHYQLPGLQHSLAVSYAERFRIMGDKEDLETALTYDQAAVDGTPSKHPDLPGYQWSLALMFTDKFKKLGGIENLKKALHLNQAAIDGTPSTHSELADYQQSLAELFSINFQETGDPLHMEAALRYAQAAVDGTPPEHPNFPKHNQSLAVFYTEKFQETKDVQDLNTALKLYSGISKSKSGPPHILWQSACRWAELCIANRMMQEALQAYTAAFSVLPTMMWLGTLVEVRHNTLIRYNVSSVVSAAVDTAIHLNDIQTAAVFLEQGLSITHTQTLQLKSSYDMLLHEFPEKAKELQSLSLLLRGSATDGLKLDHRVNYNVLADQRDKLLNEIHQNKGFEQFLLLPNYQHICLAAQCGPVIMLNETKDHTNAIIFVSLSKPPQYLKVPKASSVDIQRCVKDLQAALQSLAIKYKDQRLGRPFQANDQQPHYLLSSVTSWMWMSIVKPIFGVLGKEGLSQGRLWWCPSGLLTHLPLHAAAPLGSSFVQSYTPSLEALIQASNRYNSTPLSQGDPMTAVGVAETLSSQRVWRKLPSVEKELQVVTALFGAHSHKLEGVEATVESVMAAIKVSAWLHLACHGYQDPVHPLDSGLVLHDGILELSRVLGVDLPLAKFLFLSACETAMGDARLANESVHLAAGFIFAGFQGAIGTMWGMTDADGPNVAEVVYGAVLGKNGVPDVRRAAEGLHTAVVKLREGGVPLHQWMPFIHMGI